MSKEEKLLDALSGVRDGFIEEGDLSGEPTEVLPNARSAKIRRRRIWTVSIAAALVCALGLTGAGLILHRSDGKPGYSGRWETKIIDPEMHPAVDEIGIIPRWEDATFIQRYPELQYGGVRYSGSGNSPQGAIIPAEQLGEPLGQTTVSGHDIYTERDYTVGGRLYAIDGIDPACAVALLTDGQTEAYAYMNHYYRPSSLGDLLDALSLSENLTFGSVYIEERDESGDFYTVEFPEVPDEKIWALLADRDARCATAGEYEEIFTQKDRFEMAVNLPLLGISNLSLSVTEDGWLCTNLMGQGHAFYIGNAAADAFMDYLLTECKGYRWVYRGTDGDPVPEAGGDGGVVTAIGFNPQAGSKTVGGTTVHYAEPRKSPEIG